MKNVKFAVGRNNQERFDKNNKSIVRNILLADETDKKLTEIKEAYISKYNYKRILLNIIENMKIRLFVDDFRW